MARKRRIVIPGIPLHCVARGACGQQLFHDQDDYDQYLLQLNRFALLEGVDVHAYCLMPNHIHLLLTPQENPKAIAKFFQRLHTWFAVRFNAKHNKTGHVFGERYFSSCLDDAHFWAAMRYIELNPVRAGLVKCPSHWKYSSARFHLSPYNRAKWPVPLSMAAFDSRFAKQDWSRFLLEKSAREKALTQDLRRGLRSGRSLGTKRWLKTWGIRIGRPMTWKTGPPPRLYPDKPMQTRTH